MVRNWHAFNRLKIGSFSAPGTFFANGVGIDFPVSMGSYRFAQNPSEPVVLHLGKVMTSPGEPSRE